MRETERDENNSKSFQRSSKVIVIHLVLESCRFLTTNNGIENQDNILIESYRKV